MCRTKVIIYLTKKKKNQSNYTIQPRKSSDTKDILVLTYTKV